MRTEDAVQALFGVARRALLLTEAGRDVWEFLSTEMISRPPNGNVKYRSIDQESRGNVWVRNGHFRVFRTHTTFKAMILGKTHRQ